MESKLCKKIMEAYNFRDSTDMETWKDSEEDWLEYANRVEAESVVRNLNDAGHKFLTTEENKSDFPEVGDWTISKRQQNLRRLVVERTN